MPVRPEFDSPTRTTTVELNHGLVTRFREAAAKRDMTAVRLVSDLLDVIATDNLVSAVLDDEPYE